MSQEQNYELWAGDDTTLDAVAYKLQPDGVEVIFDVSEGLITWVLRALQNSSSGEIIKDSGDIGGIIIGDDDPITTFSISLTSEDTIGKDGLYFHEAECFIDDIHTTIMNGTITIHRSMVGA